MILNVLSNLKEQILSRPFEPGLFRYFNFETSYEHLKIIVHFLYIYFKMFKIHFKIKI